MMGDGLPPAAAAAPSSAAASASARTAAQNSAPAQGAANAAGRGNEAPARADGGETGSDTFDLLLSGQSASTSSDAGTMKSGIEEQMPAADAVCAPDQLLLLLAQMTPAVTTPAQATPAQALPAAGTAVPTAGASRVQLPFTADPPPQSTGAADPAQKQDSTSDTGLAAVFARLDPAPANNPLQAAAGGDAPSVALPTITEGAQSAAAPIDLITPPPAALHGPQGVTPNALSSSSAPTAPVPPLPQPADPTAGYDDSFGTQVSWLAEQRIGEAQIRISPEHLGAIDIRLQLEGDQVRAEFHSAHAEVRQTLEASLPRLRELLGQHGLQLAHAGVGQGRKQSDDTMFARLPGTASRNEGDALPPATFRRARGLLDVYA